MALAAQANLIFRTCDSLCATGKTIHFIIGKVRIISHEEMPIAEESEEVLRHQNTFCSLPFSRG